jgi:hypothetical protein
VGVEEVCRVEALATQLGVEIEAPGSEPSGLQDGIQRERDLLWLVRELVGVPAELGIAAVHVDAAEDPVGHGVRDLVRKAVSRERGVVHLDVELELVFESVLLEEGVHGRGVVIVLVLRGLVGLGFDQERPLESDRVLVLGHEGEEAPELVELAAKVGVEKCLVALAPTPEHVVGAAEPVRRLEHVLHLGGRVREDVGVRVGGGTGGVARMTEQVRGAPQQPHAGALHPTLHLLEHAVEVGVALGEGCSLGRHVAIVEAEEGVSELLEELEGHLALALRQRHRVAAAEPRAVEGTVAEDVASRPAEAVPVADRHAQVVLEAPAQDLAVRVVPAKCQRALALGTRVTDPLDLLEEGRTHLHSPSPAAARNAPRRSRYRARQGSMRAA